MYTYIYLYVYIYIYIYYVCIYVCTYIHIYIKVLPLASESVWNLRAREEHETDAAGDAIRAADIRHLHACQRLDVD